MLAKKEGELAKSIFSGKRQFKKANIDSILNNIYVMRFAL